VPPSKKIKKAKQIEKQFVKTNEIVTSAMMKWPIGSKRELT
jgi:hypothetical protein